MSLFSIPKPFDGHAHLRSGAVLRAVLPHTAAQFGRAVAMPNLLPPVTTAALAKAYRDEILSALPEKTGFTPIMALYLTDHIDPGDLTRGFEEGVLTLAKLYPANATTNSDFGVTDIRHVYPALERMQQLGMVLSIHGETGDPGVDIFDREAVFIDRVLIPLRRDFPALKIVFEHLTCRQAVDYVLSEKETGTLAGGITAHHLRITRNDVLLGGLRPHFYCMPIAKQESDRQALIAAATSGAPVFFAGTDSAPHPRAAKESAKGASGCFTHINALAIYAQVFDDAEALDRLAAFASLNGPSFYNLPAETASLQLEKSVQAVGDLKSILTSEGAEIIPFQDDAPLYWRVKNEPQS
ncbi:MAG: dihydroorotase [Alphaproteobacteria bacterium]|nr:dihydroorotase [Alphaproteobacteria bacterium]